MSDANATGRWVTDAVTLAEFVARLLSAAIIAHYLPGVAAWEVEHGDGDEAWCGGWRASA